MEMQNSKYRKMLFPLLFSIAIVVIDQLTKFLVVKNIPYGGIGFSFFGDFLRIVHVRNFGVAFSLGSALPSSVRRIFFAVAPLVAVVFMIPFFFNKNDEFSAFERIALAGIVGGAFGNLIDRFFRPAGVVDFIDVKFYNLFGLERWPTFNVADCALTVSAIFLFFSFVFKGVKKEK